MVRPDANGSWPSRRRAGEDPLARCVELAGASPALVIAGEPGSRLPGSGEIPALKRSVESPSVAVRLPGGEQSCGPSLKRTLQPRDIGPRKGGVAEPLISRRRQQTASEVPERCRTPPGYGGEHVATARHGTGEALAGSPRRAKAAPISGMRSGVVPEGSPRGS